MKTKFGVILAGTLLAATSGSSLADPPHRVQGGKNGEIYADVWPHFSRSDRVVVREYYEPRFSRGHCPPGLAKKGNGCRPPGHAKQWRLGERLPSTVVYYELPRDVIVRLGPPPRGYRYVRVDNDILLLAIGTGLVLDAIQNMGS